MEKNPSFFSFLRGQKQNTTKQKAKTNVMIDENKTLKIKLCHIMKNFHLSHIFLWTKGEKKIHCVVLNKQLKRQ